MATQSLRRHLGIPKQSPRLQPIASGPVHANAISEWMGGVVQKLVDAEIRSARNSLILQPESDQSPGARPPPQRVPGWKLLRAARKVTGTFKVALSAANQAKIKQLTKVYRCYGTSRLSAALRRVPVPPLALGRVPIPSIALGQANAELYESILSDRQAERKTSRLRKSTQRSPGRSRHTGRTSFEQLIPGKPKATGSSTRVRITENISMRSIITSPRSKKHCKPKETSFISHNGISKNDFTILRQLFEAIDTNENGKISMKEYSDNVLRLAPHMASQSDSMFASLSKFTGKESDELTFLDFVYAANPNSSRNLLKRQYAKYFETKTRTRKRTAMEQLPEEERQNVYDTVKLNFCDEAGEVSVSKIKHAVAKLGSECDENWLNCDMSIHDIAEAYAQMALVTVNIVPN